MRAPEIAASTSYPGGDSHDLCGESPLSFSEEKLAELTQCRSTVKVSVGKSRNAFQSHLRKTFVPSSITSSQRSSDTCGVGPADKTGKSVVRCRPCGSFTSAALRRPEKPRAMIPTPQFSFPSEVELSLPHSSFHFHQALDCPPNSTHISFSSRAIFHPIAESGSPDIAQSDPQDG